MRSRHECHECAIKQARRVYNLFQAAREKPEEHLDMDSPAGRELRALVDGLSLEQSPAEYSQVAIEHVMRMFNGEDPFRALRLQTNLTAMGLYTTLREMVSGAEDPVAMGFLLAAVGNVIDLGIQLEFDLEKTLQKAIAQGFVRDHTRELKAELEKARTLLYLCDNSGEILFDRVCIEVLRERYPQVKITAVVKSGPILNDAMMQDARIVGLPSVVPVIETGSGLLGTLPGRLTPQCREAFATADVIISKGQANYETLEDRPENIFLILMAKCEVVADHLGVKLHDMVLIRKSR